MLTENSGKWEVRKIEYAEQPDNLWSRLPFLEREFDTVFSALDYVESKEPSFRYVVRDTGAISFIGEKHAMNSTQYHLFTIIYRETAA